MSLATEKFVKAIFHFEQNEGFDTRPGSIAKSLGVSNAAATDMARKLADKKLVYYEKYQALKLTPDGKRLALKVIRKHRLWESFLHKTFEMDLHEIHREAELLEYQTSDFMAEKISQYLGNPSSDPHGDPIPNINGEWEEEDGLQPLSESLAGNDYRISRLFSSDKEFFEFCHQHNLHIGSILKVEKQYVNSKMTEITIGQVRLVLNEDFAKIIFVKQE